MALAYARPRDGRTRALSEAHPQGGEPPHAGPGYPVRLRVDEREPGEAVEQGPQRDLTLLPGQRRAQAVVDAVPEADVPLPPTRRTAGDVEPVRVGVHPRV